MSNCIYCGDDLSGERFPTEAERDCAALQIGRRWLENSSIELWFPISAEQIAQLTKERDELTHATARLESAEKKCRMLEDEVETWTDSAHSILKRAESAEKERDQLAAKCEVLTNLARSAYGLIIEHHSSRQMREDLIECFGALSGTGVK